MALHIKNWKKLQHYKNRRPPWIKLYRELIDDPEYHALPAFAAKYLPLIWLIASESDGTLPASDVLAFRLRIDSATVGYVLRELTHWLYDDASTALAGCPQDATPEGETETEIETEIEGEGEEAPPESIEDPTYQRPAVSTKLQQAAFSLFGNVPTVNVGEWLEGHEETWILAAMRVSESAGKASVAYTAAILRRWKAEGYPDQCDLPEDKEHMAKMLARVQEIRDSAQK